MKHIPLPFIDIYIKTFYFRQACDNKDNYIFTHHYIVKLYLDLHNPLTKVAFKKSVFKLSVNQSEQPFQSVIIGYTPFTFHFNKEHGLFKQ